MIGITKKEGGPVLTRGMMRCVSEKIGDERTRRDACSKMLAVAGVANWSGEKKEIKVGRDASQCRCTCTRCSLQILLPILPFFLFFYDLLPHI